MADDKALQLLSHIGRELELLWLQMEMWHELFDIEQDTRGELLQASAPGFFAVLNVTLAESMMMRVARVMDPPKIVGHDNSGMQQLVKALPEDERHTLVAEIESLGNAWGKDAGEYARLKLLRNKWLAHNDTSQRESVPADELCIPLSHEDFVLLRQLAGQLWQLYRRANLIIRDIDVAEPAHAFLNDRSAELLKHLCASAFLKSRLSGLPDEQIFAMRRDLAKFEESHMGIDRIRNVFEPDAWQPKAM